MFEIILFLFENFMDNDAVIQLDDDTIFLELQKLGFEKYEIDSALRWLNGLTQFQTIVSAGPPITTASIRHYLPEEVERLGREGQGFLLYLEQIGILDPLTREIVIDRIMAFDHREVDLDRIRWVVLLVLFNQPNKKTALSLMQEMVLIDEDEVLH